MTLQHIQESARADISREKKRKKNRGGKALPRISEDTVNEIKFRNSIEDVISSYVTLKRAGANMVGLCPFHSEKSPSFTVFPNDGSFYCFGCGAGGDVISFVRRAENLDYPSALEFLARRAGITIVQTEQDGEQMARRRRTLEMNREAARFFHECLFDPALGQEGLAYLREKRKLSPGLIRHFGLGFAPNDFGRLTDRLHRLGYKDYEMTEAFLCGISKKSGRPFDLFRNRVIFPIIDPSGDVVAFGGRVMDDSKPKYLNSSDTPAFRKSRTLFALNFARKSCGEQMILCEGYMDVIALHGAGFDNAVATLGTAITAEHARLMKRYTKSVVISYDADEAGQRAADKAFRQLADVGLEARVLRMNGAKDPDEYIRSFGTDGFSRLLKNTKSEFDFRMEAILQKYNVQEPDGKIKALDALVNVIAGIGSAARREVYAIQVAERLGVGSDVIRHDVEQSIRNRDRRKKQEESDRIIAAAQGVGDRVNTDFVKNPHAAAAEEKILGILLLHPEYLTKALREKTALPPEDFFTEFGRKVYERMLSFEGESYDISRLGESLTVEEVDRLTLLKMNREALTDNSEELLKSLTEALRQAVHKESLSLEELIRQKREAAKKKQQN